MRETTGSFVDALHPATKIFAIQTGYRLSIGACYRYVEVDEPLSLVEHGNGLAARPPRIEEQRAGEGLASPIAWYVCRRRHKRIPLSRYG